jgi:FMN phosphatase YigB (HAD superfamily)
VKALLLDLDDTLLDYSGGAERCWAEACAAVAGSLEQERLVAALTASRRWFWDDPERHRRERRHMLRAWTQIAAHALEAYARRRPSSRDRDRRGFSTRRRAVMALFPEALACLEALRARGCRSALVTNGDAIEQRWKIERCALAPFFDAIVIEGELGHGKPDADRLSDGAEGARRRAGPGRLDGGRSPGLRRGRRAARGAAGRLDRSGGERRAGGHDRASGSHRARPRRCRARVR